MGPGGVNARKTKCKNGHPFSEANTCFLASGKRQCRTCNREAVRRHAAKRKARVKPSAEAPAVTAGDVAQGHARRARAAGRGPAPTSLNGCTLAELADGRWSNGRPLIVERIS
jgi:hypothetical protein